MDNQRDMKTILCWNFLKICLMLILVDVRYMLGATASGKRCDLTPALPDLMV
jgi:hypothetical protein